MPEEVVDGRRLSEGVNRCAPARREVNGSYWIERACLTVRAQRSDGEDRRLEPQQVESRDEPRIIILGSASALRLAEIQCSRIF